MLTPRRCKQAGVTGWLQLLPQLCSLPELLHMPASASCLALGALSQLEDRQYIHVAASEIPSANQAPCSHEAGRDPSQLEYHLTRLGLKFTQTGSRLESADFRGYHVTCTGETSTGGVDQPQLSDVASRPPPALPPGLCQALVLYPDSAVAKLQVLLPVGELCREERSGAVTIHPARDFDAQVPYYVYAVHPRTGLLSGRTVAARLYLAALFVACSHTLPLPGTGHTGAALALELLRQSFVNRPLSGDEARHLRELYGFATHVPAVRLKSAQLAQDSAAVQFLFAPAPRGDGSAAPSEQPPPVVWPHGDEARYQHELHSAPAPYADARKVPTPHEASRIVGHPAFARQGLPAPPLAKAHWPLAGTDKHGRAVLALLGWAAALGQAIVQQGAAPRGLQRLPFDAGGARRSRIGSELVTDLEDSLGELAREPAVHIDEGAVHRIAPELRQLAAEASELVRTIGTETLTALDVAPAGNASHVLSSLRAAGLLATPTLADLLLATIRESHIEVCRQVACLWVLLQAEF